MKTSWLIMVAAVCVSSAAYAKNEPQVDNDDMVAVKNPAVATKPASSEIEGSCNHLRHTVAVTATAEVKSFEAARAKFDTQLEQLRKFAVSKHIAQLGLISLDYGYN